MGSLNFSIRDKSVRFPSELSDWTRPCRVPGCQGHLFAEKLWYDVGGTGFAWYASCDTCYFSMIYSAGSSTVKFRQAVEEIARGSAQRTCASLNAEGLSCGHVLSLRDFAVDTSVN